MLQRFRRWCRTAWGDIGELEQRRMLMVETWREEYLHMGIDGRMHGRFLPPAGRPMFSVTGSGWCPAVR